MPSSRVVFITLNFKLHETIIYVNFTIIKWFFVRPLVSDLRKKFVVLRAPTLQVLNPGLAGAGTISFESVTNPGRYLRHRDGVIYIEEGSRSDAAFRADCSWLARMDHFFTGFVSFELAARPGWFIRHRNSRRLELSEISTNTDRNDASFVLGDMTAGTTLEEEAATTTEAWRQFLDRTVEVESKAVPGHYWAWQQQQAGGGPARLEVESHVFRLVAGLWGDNTVSFESTTSPGHYLRARGDRMWVEQRAAVSGSDSETYGRECSFNPWDGRFFAGYTSFEAADRPDQWIRQRDRQLLLESVQSYQDNNDASFLLSEAAVKTTTTPPPPTTTTTARTTTARASPRTRTPTTTTPKPVVYEARGPGKRGRRTTTLKNILTMCT